MRTTHTAAYRAWLQSYWLEGLPAALLVAALGSGALVAGMSGGRLDPAPNDTGVWPILGNNLRVLAMLSSGVVSCGIAALTVLVVIGLVFGYSVTAALQAGHVAAVWSAIAPHALPELLGFVVAAGAVLRLGVVVARRVWRSGPVAWRPHLRRWLRCQTAAVGLICLAALFEGTISHV